MFIQLTEKKNFSLEHNLMAASVRANNNKFNTLIMFFFSDRKTWWNEKFIT